MLDAGRDGSQPYHFQLVDGKEADGNWGSDVAEHDESDSDLEIAPPHSEDEGKSPGRVSPQQPSPVQDDAKEAGGASAAAPFRWQSDLAQDNILPTHRSVRGNKGKRGHDSAFPMVNHYRDAF